jgi:hypothetical protein
MTKREQRNLITQYGASQLEHTPLFLLKEMVSVNWLGKDPEADAEAKPFRVSMTKLAARTNLSRQTISRNLQTLVAKNLLTILEEKGKSSLYQLHVGIMNKWETVREIRKKGNQVALDKKAKWIRVKRQRENPPLGKVRPEMIPTKEDFRSFFERLRSRVFYTTVYSDVSGLAEAA